MNCPHCKDVTLTMTERQGVEIDYCPKCRGVWLDRGELDKIIERAEREDAASPQPQPPQGYPQGPGYYPGGHHGGYRRKSFWKEIFD